MTQLTGQDIESATQEWARALSGAPIGQWMAPANTDRSRMLAKALQHCMDQFGAKPSDLPADKRLQFYVELGVLTNFIVSNF